MAPTAMRAPTLISVGANQPPPDVVKWEAVATAGPELPGGPAELATATAELLGGVLEGTSDAGFGVRLGKVGGELIAGGMDVGAGATDAVVGLGAADTVGVGFGTGRAVAVGLGVGFTVGLGVGLRVGFGVGDGAAPTGTASTPMYWIEPGAKL